MRSSLGVIALVLVAAANNSCSSGSGNTFLPPEETNFVTTLTLRGEDNQPDTDFRLGETIFFDLRIQNVSGVAQHVDFRSSCKVGFVVRNETSGETVLDGSQVCQDVLSSLDFEPGETKLFTRQWEQTDDDGQEVGAGFYEVQGRMLTEEPGARSDWEQFRIY